MSTHIISRSLFRPTFLYKNPLSHSLAAPALALAPSRRSMANKAKREFLCIIHDKPNSLARRMQVRP